MGETKRIKWNIELVKEKCKEIGIKFLDEQYTTNRHKYNFKCKCGEIFSRQWGVLIRNKCYYCIKCLGISQYTTESVKKYLSELGYELISKNYMQY